MFMEWKQSHCYVDYLIVIFIISVLNDPQNIEILEIIYEGNLVILLPEIFSFISMG